MTSPAFAAVDVGASGGRVMVGTVDDDGVHLDTVHRFPNGVVEIEGHLRWDLRRIFREVATGLAQAPDVRSIGIDTWGVDYARIDGAGQILDDPIAYRDTRTDAVVDQVHERIAPSELFAINGLQFLPFTTLYQLVADPPARVRAGAAHALLIPDVLAFWLTGTAATELTNASTTGLIDARTRDWSYDVIRRLDLPIGLFPPLREPGTNRGTTAAGVPVINVASHDTASAVVGVPATTDRFAYIACGTWSLVGLELPAPVLTERARVAGFSNEIGADGRTRFLRNVGGLWLLQECLREWGDDLEALLEAAAHLPAGGPTVEVDHPSFIAPDDMPARITAACGADPMSRPEITRCILDSLAEGYARTIQLAAEITGAAVEVVHIVGGGSQNALLCQLVARAVQLPVLAGPAEATAFGNVLVQARAADAAPATLEGLRALLASSVAVRRYEP